MSLNSAAVFNALESHLLATGLFHRVNTHEPKSAPQDPLVASVTWASTGPAPAGSGLKATTGLCVFLIRIYNNMLSEPQDAIDPTVLVATDVVMEALTGDFELGGNVRNVDLLGQTGSTLSAEAGYITVDSTLFRTADITVPVIINDAWPQTA